MLANIDSRLARTIVELGPGDRAVTEEILARMRPDARIYAVEINPVFRGAHRRTFNDRRSRCGAQAGVMTQVRARALNHTRRRSLKVLRMCARKPG